MFSIILPARNNAALTRVCLSTIIESLRSLNLEVEFILIDDASDPSEGILDIFRSYNNQTPLHRFTIVRAKKHLHYTGVFSIGLHLAKLENVFFVSNDMFVTPHFFAAVLGVAALNGQFGIVRGTSNFTDSHPEHTVLPKHIIRTYDDICAFSKAIFETNGYQFVEDRVLSGDAIYIKRAVLDKIGVMDVQFFGYFGDVDFGMRCHLAGFKLVCAKGAWLHHQGAGHVRAQAAKENCDFSVKHKERMQLVNAAYQLFRQKWDTDLPSAYDELANLELFPIAEKNRHKINLRYDLPPSISQAYDIVESKIF